MKLQPTDPLPPNNTIFGYMYKTPEIQYSCKAKTQMNKRYNNKAVTILSQSIYSYMIRPYN